MPTYKDPPYHQVLRESFTDRKLEEHLTMLTKNGVRIVSVQQVGSPFKVHNRGPEHFNWLIVCEET